MCGCENFASRAPGAVEAKRKAEPNPAKAACSGEKCKNTKILSKKSAQKRAGWRNGMAYLLELLDGTLVDTTALVDQVTGGGRLTGVDVADNDDVDVRLFLTAGAD